MNLLDLPVEVLDLILSQLNTYELLKFSETSRYSYYVVKAVKQRYIKFKPTMKEFWNFKRQLYYTRYNKLSYESRESLLRNYCKKLNVDWRHDSALFDSFIEGYLQKSPLECVAIMKCVQFLHTRNAYSLLHEHVQPLLQKRYYDEIIKHKKKSNEAWNIAIDSTIEQFSNHLGNLVVTLSMIYQSL
tara:strand:+ start:33013 stop:33573 length:561 start_codon:yes stop_codon:yes gene_type:complete